MELFFFIYSIHLLTHITNDNNTQSCAYDIFFILRGFDVTIFWGMGFFTGTEK